MKSGIKEDVHINNELVLHEICHIEDIGVKHAGEIKCHKKHTDLMENFLLKKSFWNCTMLWNQCFVEQSGIYISIKQLKLKEVLVKIFWHQRGCPRMKSGIKGDVHINNELVLDKICLI